MENTHWLKYAHTSLRELGLQLSDLNLNTRYKQDFPLDESQFDKVRLIKMQDLLYGRESRIDERLLVRNRFKGIVDRIEVIPNCCQVSETIFGDERLIIALERFLFFNHGIPTDPNSYKSFNGLFLEAILEQDKKHLDFYGYFGEDFTYAGAPAIHDLPTNILDSLSSFNLKYEIVGLGPDQVSEQHSRLTPKEYIDSSSKFIAGIYHNILH